MSTTIIDPDRYDAVLFDMDGVITDTTKLHRAAWRRLFDTCLPELRPTGSEDQRPFTDDDYARYVDGKRRLDGMLDFLLSRGIDLPRGGPQDPPGKETAYGLGKLKDEYFREAIAEHGVEVLEGAVEVLESLRRHHIRTAVISASRNCLLVLATARLTRLFDARVDGVLADELGLHGKPWPAIFLEAARALGVSPARSVVIEDSRSGIQAGKRGNFGMIVGMCGKGAPDPLLEAGAHAVIDRLSDITVESLPAPWERETGEALRRRS